MNKDDKNRSYLAVLTNILRNARASRHDKLEQTRIAIRAVAPEAIETS